MSGIRLTAADVAAWSDPEQESQLTLDEAISAFHTLGPRARFLKTLPRGSVVLDAGAGDGTSLVYKTWPAPAREDLRMFAWAGDKGEHFEKFEGWEVGYWPEYPPSFEHVQFDAIFSANFLEHIDQWPEFIRLTAGRLKSGGNYYLEWPRMESMDLPTTADLLAAGVNVAAGRYDDDHTHRQALPVLDDVLSVFDACGFEILERGVVRVPMIDQQLAIHGRRTGDNISTTLGYWSMSGWCQYLVAVGK